MTHLHRYHKQGFALITTLIMLIVFLAILTTYTFLTSVETRTSDASVDSATGFYAAESGYNLRAEDVRAVFQDFRRPDGTAPNGSPPCINGGDGTGAFACVSYELNDRTIHTYVQEDDRNGEDGRATTVSTGIFAGLNAIEYGYDFFSDAYPPNEIRPEASIETRLNIQLIPLFQFAAFYNKDLEIHPGPKMTLNGRVHVNGNLYMTSSGGLDITGQVSASGYDEELWPNAVGGGTINTFRKDKDDDRSPASVFDGDDQRNLTKGKTYTQTSEFADWNERVEVGLDPLIVPPANDFSIDDAATYWSKADLRILLRVPNSGNLHNIEIEVHDNDGTITPGDKRNNASTRLNSCAAEDEYPPYIGYRNNDYAFFGTDGENPEHAERVPDWYSKPNGTPAANATPLAVEWSNTFYDGREKTDMLFMEVDVKGLLNCITKYDNDFEFDIDDESGGGLVWYLSIEGDDSADVNNYGIRIRNGDELAATTPNNAPDIAGLTIVSDQAIYIQGDYNMEASDENNTTWRPASFLGDTMNVLSEQFDDDFTKGGNDEGGWDASVYWWDYTKDADEEDWVSETRTDNKPDNDHYMHSGRDNDRKADDTIIRAAVLGGTDKTGGKEGTEGEWKGSYNGGLENYPRFHEAWLGVDFEYAGSFVSLGLPQYKDSNWGGNYYSAPNRIWSYEEAYNNASNLPPLSPRATYLVQNSFSRSFTER